MPIVNGPAETATDSQRLFGRRQSDVGAAPWESPRVQDHPIADSTVVRVSGTTADVPDGAATTATAAHGPTAPLQRVEGHQPSPEELVKLAREEARRISQEARSVGFEQGLREGWEAGRAEAEAMVVEARSTVERTRRETGELLKEAEPELLRFAMAVARKVVRQELSRSPEAVVEIVAEALGRVHGEEEVKVRVNPRDVRLLEDSRDRLAAHCRRSRRWALVEDDSIQQGGCVVETSSGNIDARVDRQLSRIERALQETVNNDR